MDEEGTEEKNKREINEEGERRVCAVKRETKEEGERMMYNGTKGGRVKGGICSTEVL